MTEIRTTQYIPEWWKDENRRKKVMLELTRRSQERKVLLTVEKFLEKMRLPKCAIALSAIIQLLEFASDKRVSELIMYGVVD